MKPKKIKIDFNIPIETWVDENKCIIMNSIYENVFEFVDSEENDRIILQIHPDMGKEKNRRRINSDQSPVNVDFIISKLDIDLTIKKLLEHMIEIEEYEKCAEIVKLQNREISKPVRKVGAKKPIKK